MGDDPTEAYVRGHWDGLRCGRADRLLAGGVHLTGDALDVERLTRAIDAVEEGGVRGGVFDRLTTIDNGRLARSIAYEYGGVHLTGDAVDEDWKALYDNAVERVNALWFAADAVRTSAAANDLGLPSEEALQTLYAVLSGVHLTGDERLREAARAVLTKLEAQPAAASTVVGANDIAALRAALTEPER